MKLQFRVSFTINKYEKDDLSLFLNDNHIIESNLLEYTTVQELDIFQKSLRCLILKEINFADL